MKKRIGRKPVPYRNTKPQVQQVIGRHDANPPLRLVDDEPATDFNNWMLKLYNSVKARKEIAAKAIRDLIALPNEEGTSSKLPPDIATAILLEIFATVLEPAIIAGHNLLLFVAEWNKRNGHNEDSAFIGGLLSGASVMSEHLHQTGLLTDGFGARLNLITMKLNLARAGSSVEQLQESTKGSTNEAVHPKQSETTGPEQNQVERANGSEEGTGAGHA